MKWWMKNNVDNDEMMKRNNEWRNSDEIMIMW